MLTDSILENASKTTCHISFWRYNHRYDWNFHVEQNSVSIIPKSLSDISWTAWVYIRDFTLSKYLTDLGVKKIIDVGADTGCFMAFCKMQWIDWVGIDADIEAVNYINAKWINKAYHFGFEDLMEFKELWNTYNCLVCMNILHSPKFKEDIKWRFLDYIAENYKFAVLTLKPSDIKKLRNLELVRDFSVLNFPWYRFLRPFQIRYYKFTQFFLRILGINWLTDYVSIQGLYTLKITH